MRVLVNATTLVVGGSVQVGASFIDYASGLGREEDIEFLFLVSERVFEHLSEDLQRDPRTHRIAPSPARVMTGRRSRRAIRALEREFSPDIVYSVGSPSYVRFSAPELGRFTWPWGTHPSKLAWSILGPKDRLLRRLERRYKLWHMRRIAFFETQTDAAAKGIAGRQSVDPERIRVIPNALSQMFQRAAGTDFSDGLAEPEVIDVLTIAAPYPHKNLAIIPAVAAILREKAPQRRFRFTVTLPAKGPVAEGFWKLVERHDVSDCIENVGQVTLNECPALYRKAQIFLMPTLLETFSVSYLEAMHMGVPIVTTDLDFARDTCGDAALYFDPVSASSAADALLRVCDEPALRRDLIERGRARLREFPDAGEKYRRVVDWIRECAERG